MNLTRRTIREGGAIAGRCPAVDAPARPDTVESGPHRPVNSHPRMKVSETRRGAARTAFASLTLRKPS